MNNKNQDNQADYFPWLEFTKRFRQQKAAVCGMFFVLFLFLAAVFAP